MSDERPTTGGAPPAVELFSVTKAFGDLVAVDAMDLVVEENRFFAVIGPSGCGKTTTLRMIGGFEDPTSGAIHLHGEDVTSKKPYQRPVNTVFQTYALFPHLSIFENVAFGLRRHKVAEAEIRKRVGEMLELVQLTGRENQRSRHLSGGQQQRVALARALINHPRVLLLDEPLGALDLKLRKEMQIELKRIQQEVGITFIHVTHDQEEAMTMADTIAVMNKGRIERMGDPVEIYDDPRTPFVASFLGASNLMTGTISGSGAVTLGDGTVIRIDLNGSHPGDRVQIGVRPEKIQLVGADSPLATVNTVSGKVTDASFIGVSMQYLVDAGGLGEIAVVVQNVGGTRFPAGSEVVIGWDPAHCFVVGES